MQPRKAILNIKPYKPGKPIEEVKRELRLKDVIKLASNEKSFWPVSKGGLCNKKRGCRTSTGIQSRAAFIYARPLPRN